MGIPSKNKTTVIPPGCNLKEVNTESSLDSAALSLHVNLSRVGFYYRGRVLVHYSPFTFITKRSKPTEGHSEYECAQLRHYDKWKVVVYGSVGRAERSRREPGFCLSVL